MRWGETSFGTGLEEKGLVPVFRCLGGRYLAKYIVPNFKRFQFVLLDVIDEEFHFIPLLERILWCNHAMNGFAL